MPRRRASSSACSPTPWRCSATSADGCAGSAAWRWSWASRTRAAAGSPVVKPGSEFDIDCDVVIMALGTSPNPLLASTTKGLETNRRGCIMADAEGATTRPGVFAGGDAVTGAATVILAMGAGRTAARAIDKYIKSRKK